LDANSLPEGQGAIVFHGSDKFPQRRKFWVIEKAGMVKFTLEENELEPDSRLTISGFSRRGEKEKDNENYIT